MLSEIHKHLAGHPWQDRIHYFATIDSTNTYAKQLAANGASAGTIVIADHQTGGRGRLGRSFSSPSGMGVYMSVILRPNCPPEELMHLTCAAGLAAADAVTVVSGQRPGIKWTNDLILSRRKLGGILTELSIDAKVGMVQWAVVGIGINCCQKSEDFPAEIRHIATSLGLPPDSRPQLCAALIKTLSDMDSELLTNKSSLMARFRQYCVTLGQEVSILRGDEVRHGSAICIDDEGGLQVRFQDGRMETVTSGEVSVRGMYGYV